MKPTRSNQFAFALATSTVLFTGVLYSQTVEIDPGAIPATHSLMKAWEFNTDGNAEGWIGSGLGTLTVAGGVVSGVATNGDPQLSCTFTSIPLGYSTIVEFKVSVDPGALAAGGGTVFWADYGGGISGTKAKAISVPEDAASHVIRLTFPGGIKNLTSLRLDPTSGAFPKNVSYDYVRVYHYQPTSFTDVTLTASDASGATSMNSAGGWDSLAAPTTESNYFTGAFQLRTQSGTPYLPFGGSSLSVDPGGSVLFKGSGGTLVRKMTLAGGSLSQGATAATPDTARLFVPDGISVTAASTIETVAPTRTIEITGSLSGSGALSVTGGAAPANAGPGNVPVAQAAGQVVLKSDNASYSGTLTIGANSWVDLDHDNAVAGANVVVNAGGMLRRGAVDANDTTTAASWAISGSGQATGQDANRGAIYFSHNGLNATLAGPISISGASSRIGSYSAGGTLALSGAITGTGTLELWGGGGAESHIQTFILNGAATHDGQTDLLADFGSQTHLRLGADNRLPTTKKLRISATYGTTDSAGAFLDMKGFNQTLSQLQLDGTKRKTIYDTTSSGNSVLTRSATNNAFDTNGGNVSITGVTITHTGAIADSGAQIDNASVVTLNNATWNAPFYTSLGNAGAGTLVLSNNSTFSFGGELLIARNNQNGTLTVDATSLATTPNYFRIGDSATGVATVNLNGGTLASRGFRDSGAGSSVLNLNGGTLRATGANQVDWIKSSVTVNLLANGITLDSTLHKVLVDAPILGDAGSPGGGITKIGTGTVTLAGANTYTGATSVQAGSLVVDGNSSAATGAINVEANAGLGGDGVINGATYKAGANLPWTVANWTAAPTLDAGAVTIEGPLTVVIGESTLANFTEVNKTLTILSASALTVASPSEITVDASAFTTGTGTWGAVKDGNSLKLVYTAGASTSPYEAWLVGYPSITGANRGPAVDFDNDGLANGMEFLTGSSPISAADAVQPSVTRNIAGDLVVNFSRQDAAEAYPVTVESSTTLQAPWTSIVVPNSAVTGPPVTVVDNDTAPDNVTVIVASGGANKNFARVKIVIPFTP